MSEQERNDSFRAGRCAPTGSARREKDALRPPPGRGRRRVGGTRLRTVNTVGGSTSQTGPSQTMDLTQYQYDPHYQAHVYQEQPGFHPGY